MNLERYYIDADQRFDMLLIFQDSEQIKGAPLDVKEKLFYRAAVSGRGIQEVAELLSWQVSSAQVFVSETIKQYIKALPERKDCTALLQGVQKLSWHQIPQILKRLGYERSEGLDEQRLLVQISTGAPVPGIEWLSQEVLEVMHRAQFGEWQPLLPTSLRESLQPSLQAAYERRDYLETIKLNRVLLIDPLANLDALVKIVQDLVCLQRYCDALPLAFEFLSYIQTQESRGRLYGAIAAGFDEMARHTLQEHYRVQAISYHQQAIDWGTTRNCLALYNVFDLNFHFATQTQESHYWIKTQLTLREFVERAQSQGMNFHRYKQEIQASVIRNSQQTKDLVVSRYFAQILDW